MAKKSAKKKILKTTTKIKEKKENEDWAIEITQNRSDVKSFLEKFKAELAGRPKNTRKECRD